MTSWIYEAIAAGADERAAIDPLEPGAIPVGIDAREFIENGAPIGEQRARAVKAARNFWGAGHDVDAAAEALWAGLQQGNDPEREPWTHQDAYDIASDIYASPAPPIRPLERAEIIIDTTRRAAETLSPQPTAVVRGERKLRWRTAEEIATETPAEVRWVARPWFAAASITEVDAKIKAGKTTWVLAGIHAIVNGEPFMGEATERGAVVILTEQNAATFRESLRRADLLGRTDVHVLYRTETTGMEWPDIVSVAEAKCCEVGAVLLLVDTLTQFSGLRGDAENNAGDALRVMEPLQDAAARGLCVVSNRHDRKTGGDVGDSGRGSSAYGGAVDIIISMRRPEGNTRPTLRVLGAASRFSETPDRMMIELTPEGYVAIGDDTAIATQEAREALIQHVRSLTAPAKEAELCEALKPIHASTLGRVLRELVEEGAFTKVGRGRKGDPFRYSILSLQTPHPSEEKASAAAVDRFGPEAIGSLALTAYAEMRPVAAQEGLDL